MSNRPSAGSASPHDPLPSTTQAGHVLRLRERLATLEKQLGRRPRVLVGNPDLAGPARGTEQIALKARDVGFEVIYEGSHVTLEQLVASAVEEGVHLIGISVASDSHVAPEVLRRLEREGLGSVPVVVIGALAESEASRLREQGVARVYTADHFTLNAVMDELADLVTPHAA